MSLNVLGLLALHAYRRGSLRGVKVVAVLGSVPIAILATMTRTVWFSFAGSVLALILLSKSRTLRRACVGVLIVAGFGLAVVLSYDHVAAAIGERLDERGPIEYREAVYTGGWEMFLERPLLGWGFHQMPSELSRHVSGYRQKVLYPHNTYLELAVESGLVGLAFYLWLMWEMLRLARGPVPVEEKDGFLDSHFHRLWPVLLGVYWINAATVVMSYQFVNGLFFTMAGMLAAQRPPVGVRPRMLTIAYLANEYPSPVEPYVREEIDELRSRGVRIIAGSVRKPQGEGNLPSTNSAEFVVQSLSLSLTIQTLWRCIRKWM